MNDLLFSVIVPAYNREKTIGRTIQSVLKQKYTNFELIIVDDGSKDNTSLAVTPYLEDKRVKYISQENGGAQKARNHGLHLANGEFLMFLDSDDELLPNCLERVVKVYQEKPNVGSVYFLNGIYDDNGVLKKNRNDHLSGNIYKDVLEQGYLTSSSFITMRRSVFDVIGEWDEKFPASQDDDICFRISKHFEVELIPEILGIYYLDAGKGNQISSSPKRVADGWWILWNKYEEDTVQYCGNKVMARHFYQCATRYALIKNRELEKKSLDKLKKYASRKEYLFFRFKIFILCISNMLIR